MLLEAKAVGGNTKYEKDGEKKNFVD